MQFRMNRMKKQFGRSQNVQSKYNQLMSENLTSHRSTPSPIPGSSTSQLSPKHHHTKHIKSKVFETLLRNEHLDHATFQFKEHWSHELLRLNDDTVHEFVHYPARHV
ncbi:uncharacterized protein LOC121589990 [Anopheles merus]|uniref:uncharacterized protein LOC121589990 n=1 Tax=Anopheles merus TaxID=30066 RepID=UPI001BE459CB|nr:uncharacterized protein LOC121589990 [Anopheles merus]XP_041765237.1 uncharacterized protein LOC121589990 [Anopheles merus]